MDTDPPLDWPMFLERTIASHSDWRHYPGERRRRIDMDARAAFNRMLEVERVVLRDVVHRRPQDEDGGYLDVEDVLDVLESRGLYNGPPRDRVEQLDW